jgi:Holliday junction DNA helicase RuvA
MISCIQGILREKNENSATVMVGGLGYEVFLPLRTLQKFTEGEEIFFQTFHRLKEDISELYGFDTKKEKIFFQTLLSISGVGPKTALALLEFPLSSLVSAVETEDIAFLTQAQGLGKKTASRLILELKGKLPKTQEEESAAENPSQYSDIIDALESLGFDKKNIQKSIDSLPEDIAEKSEEEVMKYLLQSLSR